MLTSTKTDFYALFRTLSLNNILSLFEVSTDEP